MKVMLVTGGAGFVGSNFIRYFLRRNKDFIIVNFDKLSHRSNINNLADIEQSPRYHFIKGDICNYELVDYVFRKYKPQFVINFASECSVKGMNEAVKYGETNILGTITLLEGARSIWSRTGYRGNRFLQVSDSGVYGISKGTEDLMEEAGLYPYNPFAASKAGAEMMAMSFYRSYGMPVLITRSCENYGPYQGIDSFVPSCICNALSDKPLSLKNEDGNSRELIYVIDHCIALIRAMFFGKPGEAYNIAAEYKVSDGEIAGEVLRLLGDKTKITVSDKSAKVSKKSILNSCKARFGLNWADKYRLEDGLKETIKWYMDNEDWWKQK